MTSLGLITCFVLAALLFSAPEAVCTLATCTVMHGEHGTQPNLTMHPSMHVCWRLARTAAMQTMM